MYHADEKPIFIYRHSKEEEIEQFEAGVESAVRSGMITREAGPYGTCLDEIKDHLRPIAEAELERQGK